MANDEHDNRRFPREPDPFVASDTFRSLVEKRRSSVSDGIGIPWWDKQPKPWPPPAQKGERN